jgi:BMFP domain-containing protein YqiC
MTDKFFEDFYKLAGSAMNTAFGTVADMKTQLEDVIDSKIDAILAKRGVVTAEEFEVVRKMAQAAREKQAELEEELAELKKQIKK